MNQEQPLRSELFGVEQMRRYGKVLAESHKLSRSRTFKDRLLARLVENETILNEVRLLLTQAASEKRRILPAADWLLDNFYLVEEHVRSSKRDLPKGYSRALPRLAAGPSRGFPRVWDIALERISHGDGLVDSETLLGFLEMYQSVSTLTLGELWAVPIVLRLALIENLRRVATRIASGMQAQREADSWADRMTQTAETDPKSLILLVADMARSDPPMVSSFVAELARKLQGKGSALALPLTWIEQRLSETGLTIDQLVQSAMREQAADQVSISNSIRSLRSLGATDWKDFVESTSLVEKTLRQDPSDWYAKMDFATRDRYRHVVEDTARKSRRPENDVAQRAIDLTTEQSHRNGAQDRSAHVGFFLVDRGFATLQRTVRRRNPVLRKLLRGDRGVGLVYVVSFVFVTVLAALGFAEAARAEGVWGLQLWILAFVSLFAASGPAMTVVNWAALKFILPRPLPRLDYSEGIPVESRTLVVVPAMLSGLQHVERLVDALEVRWLANRDDNLFFGLLTDFPDADAKVLPPDDKLVLEARQRIERLNELYRDPQGEHFFLFHRGRKWNERDKLWMGYERKRGKLSDLNAFLRGDPAQRFDLVVGNQDILSRVKYVLTLDTDTQLPRDSARQLAGTMAHPLNRARYDAKQGRVVEGYGILQPRLSASLPGANRSLYAKLNGSEPGIDPYTRTVSDLYQDLFHEGSFIGKGIYDVDVFEAALKGRFAENTVLSHDLLEGCYARSGLVSDVQLFEDTPSTYAADVDRRHRWIRGDWQLIPWLRRPLTALSKGKIFDNLRRSLAPAALLFLFSFGWTAFADPLLWTLAVVGTFLVPVLVTDFFGFVNKPKDTLWIQHEAGAVKALGLHLAQTACNLAFLPYEAWFSLDAVVRTLWRLSITRKHLLEWRPSETQSHNARPGLGASLGSMGIAPASALALGAFLFLVHPLAFAVAIPVLCLWLVSPVVAWWLGRPLIETKARLSVDQNRFLRRLARKTWGFFETFVNEDENWLPPDNFQEIPEVKIAHRTSPTNIGLALLAYLGAHDLGHLSTGSLLKRTENTLVSMAKLQRYRKHFLNWYDTQTLQPLLPHYVSTVDSGNLAAHLLTLSVGLSSLSDEKILGPRLWDGLEDTAEILSQSLDKSPAPSFDEFRASLETTRNFVAPTLADVRASLSRLAALARAVSRSLSEGNNPHAIRWSMTLDRQCQEAFAELEFLAPWLGRVFDEGSSDFPPPPSNPTLNELIEFSSRILGLIEGQKTSPGPEHDALIELEQLFDEGIVHAKERLEVIDRLNIQLKDFSWMDFGFLFDSRRHLLAIGYEVDARRHDLSFYDLLASEARLASFVAIAQGQVPQENWFTLGRLLTESGGKSLLLSWSGSMFEYLMPLLVMPTYENSLLDQTYKAAVARQVEYGRYRNVPWGVSESGYSSLDASLNYQYHAFGVPGLGLKRGLVDDLVVAPYASALALLVSPEKACRNLQRLSNEGLEGDHGLYEAVDFTPSRLTSEQVYSVVRSFMAHHQGMSLLALVSHLCGQPMQKRFETLPMVRATLLLLEEKIPKASAFMVQATDMPEFRSGAETSQAVARVFLTPDTTTPEVHLLSNGRYHVLLTNAGGGYSHWKDLAVTRWREDGTRDNWGTFLYLHDLETETTWSNAFQPTLAYPDSYEVIFSEGRAEFRRRDGDLESYTEIVVSPEDDIELRRVRITNRSRSQRTIEVTSYAEVVLATSASDAAHPGFSNLFVQTEILEERRTILCSRRPRSGDEHPPYLLHLMTVRDDNFVEVSYETDRMRFLGRGNTAAAPLAMQQDGPLSGTHGPVLDPIVAIRLKIVLEPEGYATIDMVTGVGETREEALRLSEKYQGKRFSNRAFELSGTHSRAVLQQINGTEADAQLFGRLAGSILYANSSLRAEKNVLIANRRGQSGLWGYSISGDLPIVLLTIEDPTNIELVRQLVQAHSYWRQKGLAVDLVIWNEDHGGYRQQLQEQILALITAGVEANFVDRPGGVFIRSADQISQEDRILIQSASRAILSDRKGSLKDQIGGRSVPKPLLPRLSVYRTSKNRTQATVVPRNDLKFFNGSGGFSPDGREYVVTAAKTQTTPAPWVNVLANPRFGTVVSEAGMAYTWSENAHEFRLSPWNDDPVSDESGEALYLRDEESGQFWSPTMLPRRGETPYVARHGFGYSVFEHTERGISTELWIFVAHDAPVKFTRLKVRNESGRSRRLSATGYVELVLGELRSKSGLHVVTETDAATGAIFARNWFNTEFAGRVVFFDAVGEGRSSTCDRAEFLGRNGTLANPDALKNSRLSGKTGPALDPCAAIQVPFELEDGGEYEIVFRLGAGVDLDDAGNLVKRFRASGAAQVALDGVRSHWNHTLAAVQVETPDIALNFLANGWLVYEVLSSRLWGRSGYYQSGGAFGFRDQLQDSLALLHTEPSLVREHLLVCAAHQFAEGDVQHWWHPPGGRGSRTHCSDDYLWLALVTAQYVAATGDQEILDEKVSFLEGRIVDPNEDSYYDLPTRSERSVSLYEHCVQAIQKSSVRGEHGLPLIGSGDWNDGMNRVGEKGRGESVWLGFFLYEVLTSFAKLALERADQPFADRCLNEANELQERIEASWDGEWYRRAYFDDGTPLGSSENLECQIDSIAQSWSVLSGAGRSERSLQAMNSLDNRLVLREEGLIQLLTPPFDASKSNPGYIKGYLPGVRENGGQYTHAAVWAAMAFARLGDKRRAWELFSMINPVNHGDTPEKIETYKVEPYVMAADVYSLAPHTGRGGWTWYTGSAGWMYRLILESLLGVRLEKNRLRLTPCLPASWRGFRLHYRYRSTNYHIAILQSPATTRSRVFLDGEEQPDNSILLVDDLKEHSVEATIS